MTKKIIYQPLNLNLKIPSQWHEQLNDLAKQQGQSLEELLIEMIKQTLNSQVTQQTPKPKHFQANQTIDGDDHDQQLNDRLTVLEAKESKLEELENRLLIQEKLMDFVQHQITVRDYTQKLPPHSLAPVDEDDELDDEPDEILTDFLY